MEEIGRFVVVKFEVVVFRESALNLESESVLINDFYVIYMSVNAIGESGIKGVVRKRLSWLKIERLPEAEEDVVGALSVVIRGEVNGG